MSRTMSGNPTGFDPSQDIIFTGENTFSKTQTFTQPALIEGAVVQIKRAHSKSTKISGTNNTSGDAGGFINLAKSPTLFFVDIEPFSVNSDLRVTVVCCYSVIPYGQAGFWQTCRLFRNNLEIPEANNDRSGATDDNTSRGRGTGWISSTAGQDSNANTFNSNFIRQVSGIYLDTSPTQVSDKVSYSLAIRQAQQTPNGDFGNTITLNEGYNASSFNDPNANRPCATSYIQVEEIYHA